MSGSSEPQADQTAAAGTPDRMPEAGDGVGIGGAAVLGLLGSLASVGFSILRAKVTAVVLGPVGVGMAAEVNQVATLANVPATMLSGPALISGLAGARGRRDPAAVQTVYDSAVTGTVVLSVACAGLGFLASFWVLPASWGPDAWPLTLLAMVGMVGAALATLPARVLVGLARLRLATVLSIVGAAVPALLVTVGTVAWDLTGQFAAVAVAPLALLPIVYAIASRRSREIRWRPRARLERSFAIEAARVGTTALIAGFAMQLALLTVRTTLERHGGPELGAGLNGQFQAAWAIVTVYFGTVLASLGNYTFPRYAAAQTEAALKAEVDHAARFVLRCAPPIVLLAMAFRQPMVHVLYSGKFDAAADLLGLMLIGDLPKAMAWVQAGPLLYRGRIRAFLVTEMLGAAGLAGGSALLVPHLGLAGIGVAYAINATAAAVYTGVVLRRSCGVRGSPFRLAVTLGAAGLAAAGYFAGRAHWGGSLAVAAAAMAWAVASGMAQDVWRGVRARVAVLRRRPGRIPSDGPGSRAG